MDEAIKQLHAVVDIAGLPVLLGILWKISRVDQKVALMWGVFAREHGISADTYKVREMKKSRNKPF